ncbi:MAG TPA: translesion error-prone DNA polymerase V autoproteolytic subunit [Pyrinomonadaceae bacterium]|jgi:DNA polymerase V
MQKRTNELGEIYPAERVTKPLSRPLFLVRIQAGFPSPAEDFIERRIDLNRDLLKHPLDTYYIRVIGDSMEPEIPQNSIIVVDRLEEPQNGDIVVACLNADMCVKQLSMGSDGRIWLLSKNEKYPPIEVRSGDDFEIWGVVLHAIHSFRGKNKVGSVKGQAA